jgi:hypothetical protein
MQCRLQLHTNSGNICTAQQLKYFNTVWLQEPNCSVSIHTSSISSGSSAGETGVHHGEGSKQHRQEESGEREQGQEVEAMATESCLPNVRKTCLE